MHHARTACVQKGHLPVKFSPCHDFRIFVFVWLRRQRKRLFPHIRQRLQIRGKKRSERLCAAREGGRAGAEPARGAGPALLGSEPRPPCVAGLSPAPDPVISGRDKAGPRHRAPAVPGTAALWLSGDSKPCKAAGHPPTSASSDCLQQPESLGHRGPALGGACGNWSG